jgi:NAD(P)-dependent dehydrogenase (short-subunit alcohol dehydrogenase family)
MSEKGEALKREIPIGRFGEERDLDGPLLLLVSDAGRFVTGTTIVADGGQMVALRG